MKCAWCAKELRETEAVPVQFGDGPVSMWHKECLEKVKANLAALHAEFKAMKDARICVICERKVRLSEASMPYNDGESIVHEQCLRDVDGLTAAFIAGDENPQN